MAKIIDPAGAKPIDLETLFAKLDSLNYRGPEPFSEAFIEAASYYLQCFASNHNAIRAHIDRCGGIDAARSSFVPPQTFLFGSSTQFGVRANVWPKLKDTPYQQNEKALYAYDLAHNHDFNFLTVGCFGPGYTTDLYRVVPDQTLRAPGSKVDLDEHQFVQLTEGRVIAFDAFTDSHTQHPPSDISISINVIPLVNPQGFEQVFFDTVSSTLIEPANSATGRLATTVEIAAAFPNSMTRELVARIAAETDRPRLRNAAIDRLSVLETDLGC